MRGSVFYQTGVLCRQVFVHGAKKVDRIDSEHPHYQCVASYKTMETYRRVWNDFGNYLRNVWSIRDFEAVTENHVADYFHGKMADGISRQYAEKISSALGKLEVALNLLSRGFGKEDRTYDFSVRKSILVERKCNSLLKNTYHDRSYDDPMKVIAVIVDPVYRLAAQIQLESGTRFEGVRQIRKEQMKGYAVDSITGQEVGVIETVEKGGNRGNILVSVASYDELDQHLDFGGFSVDYQKYIKALNLACDMTAQVRHGSHGFRWTFARRRMREYQAAGYSYDASLQYVSWEMKHGRKGITDHYLGTPRS